MRPELSGDITHPEMTNSRSIRSGKTVVYAVGLCIASIAGYLIGNIHIENYNIPTLITFRSFNGLLYSKSEETPDTSRSLPRSMLGRLPFGLCDDPNNCATIPAEDIQIVLHSPTSESEPKDDQKSRKYTIRRTCQKFKNRTTSLSDGIFKHMFVDETHKVLYCSIPKAGCTNSKRLLMVATNDSIDMKSISKDYAHHNDLLRTLHQYPQVERDKILHSFKTFTFVRDPFIRLLSAYKDKFESLWQYRDDPFGIYFRRYATDILTKYRANATSEELRTGENVTWTEFVDYVTHLPADSFNEHWMPMYKLCAPCEIDYDFIGRIEDMDSDSKRLMTDVLHIDYEPHKLSHYFDFTSNSSEYSYKAFGDITVQQLRMLWNIYKWDFWLFGYEKPDFV